MQYSFIKKQSIKVTLEYENTEQENDGDELSDEPTLTDQPHETVSKEPNYKSYWRLLTNKDVQCVSCQLALMAVNLKPKCPALSTSACCNCCHGKSASRASRELRVSRSQPIWCPPCRSIVQPRSTLNRLSTNVALMTSKPVSY